MALDHEPRSGYRAHRQARPFFLERPAPCEQARWTGLPYGAYVVLFAAIGFLAIYLA